MGSFATQLHDSQPHGWQLQFRSLVVSLIASSGFVGRFPAPGVPALHIQRRTSRWGITLPAAMATGFRSCVEREGDPTDPSG